MKISNLTWWHNLPDWQASVLWLIVSIISPKSEHSLIFSLIFWTLRALTHHMSLSHHITLTDGRGFYVPWHHCQKSLDFSINTQPLCADDTMFGELKEDRRRESLGRNPSVTSSSSLLLNQPVLSSTHNHGTNCNLRKGNFKSRCVLMTFCKPLSVSCGFSWRIRFHNIALLWGLPQGLFCQHSPASSLSPHQGLWNYRKTKSFRRARGSVCNSSLSKKTDKKSRVFLSLWQLWCTEWTNALMLELSAGPWHTLLFAHSWFISCSTDSK